MSTKRKKQHRSPVPKEVTFLKIYEPGENPWPQDYYMCGMCGHAIAEKETVRHAKIAHHADSLRLLEIDETKVSTDDAEELRGFGLLGSEPGDYISESSPAVPGVQASTSDETA